MAYENFTRSNITNFRNELEEAIAALAEKHGLTGKVGNIKYDKGSVSAPIKFRVPGVVSVADTNNSRKLGFSESIIGKSFEQDGVLHTITGLKPGNKYSVLTESKSGNYKWPKQMIWDKFPGILISYMVK